jgi:sugar O-acyltransferase (sialic acid O-acetyltransferase NeuD family)
MAQAVFIPVLGANDDNVTMQRWLLKNEDKVDSGEIICVVESSKSTYEVESPYSGYLQILIEEGRRADFNEPVAVIKNSLDEVYETKPDEQNGFKTDLTVSNFGTQYTQKAREYAIKHSMNLEVISKKGVITVTDVKKYLEEHQKKESSESQMAYEFLDSDYEPNVERKKDIAIYGAGLGAMTVLDYIETARKYRVKYFIDDFSEESSLLGKQIIRGRDLDRVKDELAGVVCFVANNKFRMKVWQKLELLGLEQISIHSDRAIIRGSANIGEGVFIKDGAVVGIECEIGDGCIIDNNVTLAHHAKLKAGCFIAPGASLGGGVTIGFNSVVGVGASIASRVSIGNNVIISVGASVHNDIPDGSVVEGNPAKIIGKVK